MKLEKWCEKAEKLFEKFESEDRLRYCKTADGVWFTDETGHFAFFTPNATVWTVRKGDIRNRKEIGETVEKLQKMDGYFADESVHGRMSEYSKKQIRRFTAHIKTAFTNDIRTAYAQEKYLRAFPTNARYYVYGSNLPILVCIWENGQLHNIGLVMPYRQNPADFVANGE